MKLDILGLENRVSHLSLVLLVVLCLDITIYGHVNQNSTHTKRDQKHRSHKKHRRKSEKFYSNTWAVHINPPHEDIANKIAKKHGFKVIGQIGTLKGHYNFKHDDVGEQEKDRAMEKTDLLRLEEEVQWVEQQMILERTKRDGVPSDPEFNEMWYLLNTGQSSGPAGVDINVLPVWAKNITGRGIVTAVLDDGLDYTHPDLEGNYDPKASFDFNDNDADPKPRDSDPDNCHGTRCAGEVAAIANNGICGVGVAYNSKIGGVRMLDGQATDALEASALSFRSDYIDIYINCWGPKDDGKTFGKPGPIAAKALKNGAEEGRNKLGSIFIWATGNGGLTDDDCNCDGYTTSIYTISIGCIGDHGLSAYYTERCSSTLAVTFNGASHKEGKENKMVTTDLYHQCTEEFKGTSASAPLAAGIVALTLEANPRLTWRDLQHIIVNTAQITSPVDEGWMKNGAGFHFNHKFGFGRLDADAMVEAARNWMNVPPQRKCTAAASFDPQDIPKYDSLYINIPTVACETSSARVTKVEHVVLTVSFVHRRRGDVSIDLFSPAGTRSQMLSTRKYDDSDEGLDEWNFMTVHKWGESPKGTWRLKVTDNGNTDQLGDLSEESDVEELEEQVIDTQTKMQKVKWDAMRQKDPYFDAPYPPGVKKDTVSHERKYQMPTYYTEKQVTEFERSNIARPNEEYKIPLRDIKGVKNVIPRPHEEESDSEEIVPIDEKEDDEGSTARSSVPYNGNSDGDYDSIGERKSFKLLRKSKHAKQNRARSNIPSGYSVYKKGDFFKLKEDPYTSKKVQVTEEETGTQRVQVNAGYENPRITCVSGYNSCSGVLLKWVLTLYGTGD